MITKWEKIKEEVREKVLLKTFKLPDGSIKTFPIHNEGKGTGIVAVTKENKFILVKQFRPGVEDVLLELPGGYVDEGEDPLDAAKRELLEETGYTGTFTTTGTTNVSAYSNEVLYTFVATDCEKIQEPQTDPGEFLEVMLLPLEEFKQNLDSGEMSNIETCYKGLMHLGILQYTK